MLRFLLAATVATVCLPGCGARASSSTAAKEPERELPPDEQVLALLPDATQVVIEVDLARLRANPVIGPTVTRLLSSPQPQIPGELEAQLPIAERVVLAAFGVGSGQAATVTLLVSGATVPGARKISTVGDRGVWALGPPEWVDQLEQRAVLAEAGVGARLAPPKELLALRGRAMPEGAPGAALRVTARLPFDARVSLANVAGLDPAPAQVSVWGDVVDDLAIVVEADATETTTAKGKRTETARLVRGITRTVQRLALLPQVRGLGLLPALEDVKVTPKDAWVRVVFTVGPRLLGRVVERAGKLLDDAPDAP
ncbi:MAG: hypothetical protein KF773_40635 [Deltaproteobacteria bacterium]|nr:hypothetical protein [Deltaproteobacteria bacterium]